MTIRVAERVGFEPTSPKAYGFQDRSVQPLRHLSVREWCHPVPSNAIGREVRSLPWGGQGIPARRPLALRNSSLEVATIAEDVIDVRQASMTTVPAIRSCQPRRRPSMKTQMYPR